MFQVCVLRLEGPRPGRIGLGLDSNSLAPCDLGPVTSPASVSPTETGWGWWRACLLGRGEVLGTWERPVTSRGGISVDLVSAGWERAVGAPTPDLVVTGERGGEGGVGAGGQAGGRKPAPAPHSPWAAAGAGRAGLGAPIY